MPRRDYCGFPRFSSPNMTAGNGLFEKKKVPPEPWLPKTSSSRANNCGYVRAKGQTVQRKKHSFKHQRNQGLRPSSPGMWKTAVYYSPSSSPLIDPVGEQLDIDYYFWGFAKEDNLKITKLISPQDKDGKPIVATLLEMNNLLELFAKARPHCKKQDAQCRKSESNN